MALTDKLTAIANAIRSKTGGSGSLNLAQMATEIAGLPNAFVTTTTLSTHQSTDVPLCTLPDNVYAHRNDNNFTVAVMNTTPTELVNYDDYNGIATNMPNLPTSGSYPIYGHINRKNSNTSVSNGTIFYPPNSTDNTSSLGGNGKIWLNGKVLTYKPIGYFLGAGTIKIIVTW